MMIWITLALAVLALGSGLVASLPDLNAKPLRKRRLAKASILLLVLSIAIQTGRDVTAQMQTASARRFECEKLPPVDEASGAAVLNDRLYVVDDEMSQLYEFAYNGRSKPALRTEHDVRPCERVELAADIEIQDVVGVTEMEAVTSHAGKLLVVTSHSENDKGERPRKRALILEFDVSVREKPCVSRANTLTRAVNDLPRLAHAIGGRLVGEEPRVNIEGFTVAPDGMAYFGLRSPLIQTSTGIHAILLAMPATLMFSGAEARLIPIHLDRNYGVTSLEYDDLHKGIIILGNGTARDDVKQAHAWFWAPDGRTTGVETGERTAWAYELPAIVSAKAEALAMTPAASYVFLDAPRLGGVRKFPRSDFKPLR